IFLVAVAGIQGMLVVALGTLIVDSIRRRAWFRVLFNVAARSVAFGLIWLVYSTLSAPGALPFHGWLGLLTFVAVAAVDYVIGVFFVSTIIALVSQQPLLHIYREAYRRVSWVYLVTTPAGAVLAILWAIDPWMLVLGIVPLVMAQRSYKALSAWQEENRRNKALAEESRQLAGKLERLQDTTTAMMASLDPLPLLETVSLRL